MRALILLLLGLAACDMLPPRHAAVDPQSLPPLSGREQALLTTAQANAQKGDVTQAEKNYLSAVSASEGHVEAHLALAELYLAQQKPDKARAILLRALEFQPNHVAVNYQLGKLYLQANEPRLAIDAFSRGLVTQPQSLDLLSARGIAHDMLHQHSAAQRDYMQAMARNPNDDLSLVRTNLAMSYLLDNQPQKTVDLLKPVIDQPGVSVVTRHNLALAYSMLGRHTEAKKLLGNEMTEDERQASLTRLQRYIRGDAPPSAPFGPAAAPDLIKKVP